MSAASSSASDLYRNEQAARGAVHEEVPESVRDLSLVHKLMGCLPGDRSNGNERSKCTIIMIMPHFPLLNSRNCTRHFYLK